MNMTGLQYDFSQLYYRFPEMYKNRSACYTRRNTKGGEKSGQCRARYQRSRSVSRRGEQIAGRFVSVAKIYNNNGFDYVLQHVYRRFYRATKVSARSATRDPDKCADNTRLGNPHRWSLALRRDWCNCSRRVTSRKDERRETLWRDRGNTI